MLEQIALIALAAAQAAPAGPPAPAGEAPPARVRINPTKRTLRFIVPVTDNGTYLGDINLAVAPDDSLSVDSERLLGMLEPIVKPDVLARLKSAAGSSGQISAAQLSAEQITLAYDSDNLSLAIGIPPLARKREALSLSSAPAFSGQTLAPAPFSAFLNLRSSMDLVERGQDPGVTAPVSLVDGAMRAFGLVAEGEGYVSLRKQDPLFRRTGTRLVFDDLKHLVRFTAGDVSLFTRGFQGTATVAGISASRFYSVLEPGQEFRSTGSQSFTLFAPSTVETIVNGQSVEHRLLQPGTYTLQDFPLAEGSNDVRLIIDDPAGKRRTINFSVYSNLQLLEPGATEFSAFAGVYSKPATSGIAYSRDWAASGFVRRGVSQQLTAGINAQADSAAQQLGAEALFGSALGLVGVDLGLSRRAGGAGGFAAGVTFEKVVAGGDSVRGQSVRAALEYRSARFATPGNLIDSEPIEFRASAGYELSFGLDTYLAFDGQYARDRSLAQDRYSGRLSGGFRIGPGLAFVAEAQLDRTTEKRSAVLRIGLRKRFGVASTAQADVDTRGVARASLQTQGGAGVGAWSASGSVDRDGGETALNGAATYMANRAELGIAQFAGYDASDRRISDIRTSIRAGTSISFADGVVAIGRPIQEAFLVADTHRSLEGKDVILDPQGRSEQARSGSLGAAVDGTLTAYSPRTLVYSVPDAPPGYDLGAGNIQVRPPYKSGYHLRIGSDYHLLVIGRLLDRDGKPVALLAGKAIDLRAPKHPPVTMFTSRSGKFGAQGLRPGKWRIEMPTEGGPTIYEIDVTDDPSGTVRIGDVRPVK
ncbi:MAG: fimbrial biogenesis outer membrane usher protein [Bacillota bacterium]